MEQGRGEGAFSGAWGLAQRHLLLLLVLILSGAAVGAAVGLLVPMRVPVAALLGELAGLLTGAGFLTRKLLAERAAGRRRHARVRPHRRPGNFPLSAALRPLWERPVWLVIVVVLAVGWPVPAQNEAAAGLTVTPGDLASVALAAVVFARLLLAGRPDLPVVLIGLLCPLVGTSLLSTLAAVDATRSLVGVLRYTQLFVVIPLAVVLSLRSRRDVLVVLLGVLGLGVAEGLLGAYQFLTGEGAGYAGATTRAVGTFGAYNILALASVLGTAVIICTALALALPGRSGVVAGLLGGLLVVPLAFTLSRGAWVATAAAVVVVCLAAARRLGVALVVAGALALALAIGLSPPDAPLRERAASLASATSDPDQSVRDRYALWSVALDVWDDHELTGVGLRNFPLHRDSYAPLSLSSGSDISDPSSGYRRVELLSPHNLYLLILAEQGLIGAAVYLGLWAFLGFGICRRLALLHRQRRRFPILGGPSGGAYRLNLAIGLIALGHFSGYSVAAIYGDIGGPVSLLDAVLLGVLVWWVLSRQDFPAPTAGSGSSRTGLGVQGVLPPRKSRPPTGGPADTAARPLDGEPGPSPAAPASAGRHLARAAILAAVLAAVGAALGLLRDLVLATYFGASAQTDAYLVAWMVPETAVPLMIYALPLLLVPAFTKELQRSGHLHDVVSSTLPPFAAVSAAVSVSLAVLAPWIVRIVAPGLEESELATSCMRLASLAVFFIAVAGYLMSALRAHDRVGLPSTQNVVFNLAIIGCILGLHASQGVRSAAIGVFVGAIVVCAVQVVGFLRVAGGLWSRRSTAMSAGWAFAAFVPVAGYSLARHGQLYVERFLGSNLDPGIISHLNYAQKIGQLPMTLATTATFVAFPAFVRAAGASAERLRDVTEGHVRLATALVVPAIAFLMGNAHEVVEVLFERGAFDPRDTGATAAVLRLYVLGVLGHTLVGILVMPYFSTTASVWTPGRVALIGLAVTGAVGLVLLPWLGAAGLAAGNAAGITAMMLMMLLRLGRAAAPVDGKALAVHLGRCAAAAAIAVLLGAAVLRLPVLDDLPALPRVTGCGLFVLAVYVRVGLTLRIPEIQALIGGVLKNRSHA